jgi:2-polyprenyl-3-methyl-5-hydroxy-6-metoxy-1,4-benzoquinol methylase
MLLEWIIHRLNVSPMELPMHAADRIEKLAETVYLEDQTGENFIENVIHTANLPAILQRLSAKGRVLECGYGEGTITAPLVELGFSVEIVEGSERLCQAARERFGDKVTVHHSFFESFQPAQTYDSILALHVLEHVDDPKVVIQRFASWLSPGGRVVAVVPNAQSLHRQLAVTLGYQPKVETLSPRDQLVGHQRVYNLDQLVNDFEEAGLGVDEQFGYFLKIVPNSMMREWKPELLRALTTISEGLPPHLMANIGVAAHKP